MKLYNTLNRKIEDFKPITNTRVSLYTCGPTVYDYAQIGNLLKFVFDDTLRRTLEASGNKVKHVMNITDVGHLVSDADEGEDKLEKGAAREGKTVWDVAKAYTDAFKSDIHELNILPPNGYTGTADGYARATDFINQQLEMVQLLIDKGFAYVTNQAIYFEVDKLRSYGELTGQNLADKETAVRTEIVADPAKKSVHDFAVWFFTVGKYKNHSMHWPSPWGEGFPGWHLECSAIIHATLGEPIDIHTGGIDHIGTHHPNEMAQTEAAYDNKLANFWLHSDFLLVDGAKMSKSKGNFYTLQDIKNKGFRPLAYRMLCLQSHYRSSLNFTWDNLKSAQNRLTGYRAMADLRFQSVYNETNGLDGNELGYYRERIINELQNDLDTPAALAMFSSLETIISKNLLRNSTVVESFNAILEFLDSVFGLSLLSSEDITLTQKELISEREAARKSREWAKSDELRSQLLAQGIAVKDTDQGPIWSRN